MDLDYEGEHDEEDEDDDEDDDDADSFIDDSECIEDDLWGTGYKRKRSYKQITTPEGRKRYKCPYCDKLVNKLPKHVFSTHKEVLTNQITQHLSINQSHCRTGLTLTPIGESRDGRRSGPRNVRTARR